MDLPSGGTGDRLVVDRIEGRFAAVELQGGEVVDLPLAWLPRGAREGDVLRLRVSEGEDGARTLELTRDAGGAASARAEAAERLRRLRERDPGGDLEL